MLHRMLTFMAVLAVPASCLFVASQRVHAEGPGKPEDKSAKLKELLKERLAVVREIAKLAMDSYKTGVGSYEDAREATRIVLQVELDLCDSDKERIAVLEKLVIEAKKAEDYAEQRAKTGQAPTKIVLKAKADRLQAEIALEQAKAKVPGQASLELNDKVALAAIQVDIKRAAVKIAQAQKKIAVAAFATMRAQVAEAQAAESLAEQQFKRVEELAKQQAVAQAQVDERRAQLEAAKARRVAAEGKVLECEAQVFLEQARVELAELEAEEAELRLKQLKGSFDRGR